ncbi:MAG: prefoldin subunit beta [Archaeoglobus sp.]|nr:MAG: prefoldin subunit beta [Archaeoglobus sp.]
MGELPPQVQNMVAQMQQVQQQLQAVIAQRIQVEGLLKETNDALEEVKKIADDDPVFKVVGNVLVKSSKEDVVKELEERKETYEVRINTLKRQEDRLKDRLAEIQKKLQSILSPQAG